MTEPVTIKIGTTNRGFSIGKFRDANGYPCSIQRSSAMAHTDEGGEMIWLGRDDVQIQQSGWHPGFPARSRVLDQTEMDRMGLSVFGRMHLNQRQVAALIPLLQHFVEHGELPESG